MSSRSESKSEARKARLVAEEEAASKARRQRIWALAAGAALFAAIIVVVLIVISSGGSDSSSPDIPGDAAIFDGIPQKGIELGDSKAPVTLVEFADPQCPFCRAYTADVMPGLVTKYVKAGDLRMEMNLLTFIGDDSLKLARAAYGASDQNRMWQWMDIAYARQEQENSGYATADFIDGVSTAAGLNPAKVNAAAATDAVTQQLSDASTAAQTAGISSTPGFQVGPTGGTLKTVSDPSQLQAAIDEQLAAAK